MDYAPNSLVLAPLLCDKNLRRVSNLMKLPSLFSSAVLLGAVSVSLAGAPRSSGQTASKVRTTTTRPVTTLVPPVTNDAGTGTSAATSPVGFITTTCLANTDTNLSIPFTRPAAFIGAVTGGTNVNATTGTITFSGTPFTASAYKYAQGTQSNKYYAYVTGGTKEGGIYDITDNTTNSLTVSSNGDDLSTLGAGVQVRVIPHWTLGTAFTLGQSVIGSGTLGAGPTQVLVPDQATAGTDLLAAATYYYYTGTAFGGPGWRLLGGVVTKIYDDTILYPETFFILRNNSASNVSFVPVGSVSTLAAATTSNGTSTIGVNIATVLATIAANTDQDNAVALPAAVDTTLTASNLQQSGAFVGSSTIGGGDQLLVYDNTATGTDKLASKTYYYYTGTLFNGAGWRQFNDSISTLHNADILKAGVGFIVRKRGTTTPQSVVWNYRPIVAP